MELLSANIANADTPGFKARDIDFAAAMEAATGQQRALAQTHERHIGTGAAAGSGNEPLYRVPSQPSLDGNTVETQREHAAFMDNAIRYQASLNFLDGRLRGLLLAMRGE
jgi:flagellar basal-body rod protein FlgB